MLNIYLSQILNLLSGENLSSTNTINSLVVSIATDNDFIVEQIERLISNSSLLIKVRSSSSKYGIMPDWSKWRFCLSTTSSPVSTSIHHHYSSTFYDLLSYQSHQVIHRSRFTCRLCRGKRKHSHGRVFRTILTLLFILLHSWWSLKSRTMSTTGQRKATDSSDKSLGRKPAKRRKWVIQVRY